MPFPSEAKWLIEAAGVFHMPIDREADTPKEGTKVDKRRTRTMRKKLAKCTKFSKPDSGNSVHDGEVGT